MVLPEVGREQEGPIPFSNHRHWRRWGWHCARTMLTRGSSVGSGVLGLKQPSPHSPGSPCAILRGHGQNAPCPPHCSKHTSFKGPLFYTNALILPCSLQPGLRPSCCPSLLSGCPAASLQGNSLPFSASPQIRPPRQLWYCFDHQHLAHSCCGCSWTVSPPSPKGSASLISYLLSKWYCPGVHSTQMVSILVFPKFLQTSFSFSFSVAHCFFGTSSRRRSCLCQSLAHWPPCTSF